jgi:hypothetical protein
VAKGKKKYINNLEPVTEPEVSPDKIVSIDQQIELTHLIGRFKNVSDQIVYEMIGDYVSFRVLLNHPNKAGYEEGFVHIYWDQTKSIFFLEKI